MTPLEDNFADILGKALRGRGLSAAAAAESAGLTEAAMERRPGPEYDFNGDLLDLVLHRLAAADPITPVIVAMLFLAPGRHAGPGGDIAAICAAAQADCPGFQAHPTPLVGSHPALIEILADRLTGAATPL